MACLESVSRTILEFHGFSLGSWERSKKLYNRIIRGESYVPHLKPFSKDVDLVVVNTPWRKTFEYAKVLLEETRHSQAFTTTVAEAGNWRHWPKEKGLNCRFQNRRWDSDLKTVQQTQFRMAFWVDVEAEFHFDRYNKI
jgi:hypothetical protein